MRLLFEPRDERACPLQCDVEIVDPEEQEEPVARRCLTWTHQGRMLVRAPLVQAEQDGSVGVHDLTKVVMGWRLLRMAEERLIPFEAGRHVAYANDCPCTFHRMNS